LVVRDGDDIMRDPFTCCLKAAVAKCLDFNRVAHSKKHPLDEGYLLVSGLRGISEDLIVLRFLAQIPKKQRNEYLIALLQRNLADGVAVQVKFFKANNSTQPVVGAESSDDEILSRVKGARDNLIVASKGLGFAGVPTVASMARAVGLPATYDFIYFLTSNFVHFNPGALMRMGWGRITKKGNKKQLRNVKFSASHMGGYYHNVAKFYGTILLVGFAHLLRSVPNLDAINLDAELGHIDQAIVALDRWPEVITFEEMNVRPPLFLLFRAMREVMRSEGEPIQFGQILQELKAGAEVRAS